jgi:hypothetical protein
MVQLKVIRIIFTTFTADEIYLQNPRKLLTEPVDFTGQFDCHIIKPLKWRCCVETKDILWMVAAESLEASACSCIPSSPLWPVPTS